MCKENNGYADMGSTSINGRSILLSTCFDYLIETYLCFYDFFNVRELCP